jgi:hypothetical protein
MEGHTTGWCTRTKGLWMCVRTPTHVRPPLVGSLVVHTIMLSVQQSLMTASSCHPSGTNSSFDIC